MRKEHQYDTGVAGRLYDTAYDMHCTRVMLCMTTFEGGRKHLKGHDQVYLMFFFLCLGVSGETSPAIRRHVRILGDASTSPNTRSASHPNHLSVAFKSEFRADVGNRGGGVPSLGLHGERALEPLIASSPYGAQALGLVTRSSPLPAPQPRLGVLPRQRRHRQGGSGRQEVEKTLSIVDQDQAVRLP